MPPAKTKKPKDNECGLKMYYQPIFYPMFGKTVGYEALIRLVDKELHFVSPSVFIPIAEKSGLNLALGNWIFEDVCRTIDKMVNKEIPFEYISVNVSVKHFKKKDYIFDLLKITRSMGIDNSHLCLEVPEDAFKSGIDAVLEKMQELQVLGFKVAIDGYNGNVVIPSRLDEIPADIIKIDKELTDRIMIDKNAREKVAVIAKRIIELKMEPIALAVEDKNQQKMLTEMGFKKMQGFLFGKPIQDKDILKPKPAK